MVEMRKRPVRDTVVNNKPDFERKNAQVEGEKEAVIREDKVVDSSREVVSVSKRELSKRSVGRPKKFEHSSLENDGWCSIRLRKGVVGAVNALCSYVLFHDDKKDFEHQKKIQLFFLF